jgi:hypothetical protein
VGERVRAVLDTSVVIATDVPPLEGELAVDGAVAASYTRNAADFVGLEDLVEIVAA